MFIKPVPVCLVLCFSLLISLNFTFSQETLNLLDSGKATAFEVISLPTESTMIFNEIRLSKEFSLPSNSIKRLKSNVNIENATRVIQSIDQIYYQRKQLSISDRDIHKVLDRYIQYHDDLYGRMSEDLYYDTALQLKKIKDKYLESFIVEIVNVWLADSNIPDKKRTVSLISDLLTLQQESSNLLILFAVSKVIDRSELFELMDVVKQENPDNRELLMGIEQFKLNILYPERKVKWHITVD